MIDISGKVELNRKSSKEHLDIEIIGRYGEVIKRIDRLIDFENAFSGYDNPREENINIHLPIVLPLGSKIRMVVHKDICDDGGSNHEAINSASFVRQKGKEIL